MIALSVMAMCSGQTWVQHLVMLHNPMPCSVRDHEENKEAFAGPRLFLRYAELDMHPLDTNDRRKLAQDSAGLGMCNITKCCTEVCPEGIHITDNAIIPMKERVVDRKFDPVTWLGSKIGRRDPRDEV